MADLAQVEEAFLKAHQAGDKQAAAALAGEVRRLRAQPAPEPNPSAGGGELSIGPIRTGIQTPEWLDRGLAGAGQTLSGIGTGAQQVGAAVADFVNPRRKQLSDLVTGAQPLSRVDELRQQVGEQRRLDAPLMDTTAGKVGAVLGGVAALAPTAMIPGANTYTGATTIGALTGLLQPSESGKETLLNVGLGGAGGAAGQAIANRLGALAQARGNQVTQGQQAAAQAGEAIGMRNTPGKASGSRVLQRLEAAAESNPITSGGFDAIKQNNQRVVNRAAAQSIGETADELSSPVLQRAEQRIGQVFNSVADRTPVPLDPQQVGGRLRQIAQEADGMLMGNARLEQNGLWQRLDDFVNGNGGASREQLRQLSSNLGKAARNNMTQQNGDRALGEAMFAAQEVVEDAIQGTLTAAQRQAYAQAREQYRNLMTLTAKTNVVNPSSGNVSGRGLATTLMQKDRAGFTMGGNNSDLHSAARFTQAFPDIVGDSGTATRSMGAADYLAGLPGNLLARLYLSQPVTAAARAGAGAAGIAGQLGSPLANRLAVPAGVAAAGPLANYLAQQ